MSSKQRDIFERLIQERTKNLLINLQKTSRLILIYLVFLFISYSPALSQEASGLSLGKPLEKMREPGEMYSAGKEGDWSVRCVTGKPGEADRCEIHQLLFLNENTPIADISIFKLPDNEMAVAAANVMVPLETLLTKKFRFAFSNKSIKEFPYSFCNKNGCLVRMGLLEEDIEAMKKGFNSELSVTHISSPNSYIKLDLSLKGFTAAFDKIKPF
jgi:invasion protein IalB